MPILQTSPAIRLWPPSLATGGAWFADDIRRHLRFRIRSDLAALLIAAFHPSTSRQLGALLSKYLEVELSACAHLLEVAQANRLLISKQTLLRDPELQWCVDLRSNWTRYGWEEAAEYHLTTFDYPCLDYSPQAGGFKFDQELMRTYNRETPDVDRRKKPTEARIVVPMPEPRSELLPAAISDLWNGGVRYAAVTDEVLKSVVSVTFGQIDEIMNRSPMAPNIRRTSPSGGARHPSEGYVAVLSLEGWTPGFYQVCMDPLTMRLVRALDQTKIDLQCVFRGSFARASFDVAAIIIVTSVFRRNMYRYREPRTFRVVNIDAGHLVGTATLAAKSLGVRSFVSYMDDDIAIERLLGLHGMEEGYMCSVALGPAC